MTDIFRVLAEPRRQEILQLVWNHERAVADIVGEMDVTFGAVSQHLKVLRDAGLVTMRQRGRHRFYKADQHALGPFARHLRSMWRSRLRQLKVLAEREEKKRGR